MLFEKYDPLKISKEGGKNILPEGNLYQILDINGNTNEEFPASLAEQMYEEMVYMRMADDKAIKLQRQGRMGTYASIKGQEAAQIGSVHALEKSDWVVPAFREMAVMHLHGISLENIYRYWGGFEIGNKSPDGVNVLPVSIPVGTHLLHAVGIAWAMKLQKKKQIAAAYFSDGATSEGDFHEAMNFAGVFKVPCVFFCQNNQYAISVPRQKQTASKTIAQKAVAYGFSGMQVDGNDVLAVYNAMKEAVSRGRKGEGPFFIEAVTFRQSDHTTSDDAKKYRPKDEEEYWIKRDPIMRMRLYLKSKNSWNEKWQKEIEENSSAKISKAVEIYESTPVNRVEDIFKHVYAEMTPQLKEQMEYLKQFYG